MKNYEDAQNGSLVNTSWCEYCGRGFETSKKRNRHIKQSHNIE